MPPKPNPEPSVKQLEILRFIVHHIERLGFQPSQSEIGAAFGITKNSVTGRLKGLAKRGFVTLTEGQQERAIKLNYVQFRAEYIGGGPPPMGP